MEPGSQCVERDLVQYRDFTHVGGGKTPDAKTNTMPHRSPPQGFWPGARHQIPEVLKQVHAQELW